MSLQIGWANNKQVSMMLLSGVTFRLSILCFLTAFCFPVFSTDTGPSDRMAIFAFEWLGLFVNPAASFPWLANIFYSASVAGVVWNKNKRLVFNLVSNIVSGR